MADDPDLTYFLLTGRESAVVADTDDSLTDPDKYEVWVPVTITARPEVVYLTSTTPPKTKRIRPIDARIETGVLKLVGGPPDDGVRLVANTAVLGLDGQLLYDVAFGKSTINGVEVDFKDQNFTFAAPNFDTTVDLTTVERVSGSTSAGAYVPMIPDHVRLNIDGELVFSANGVDIPDPLPLDVDVSAAIAAAIDALVGGAPGALDTLNELAAALGDDANFAATVTTALASKLGFVQAAKNPDVLVTGAVTVDSSDLITSAVVTWPDGSPGTLTITSRDGNDAVLGYNITYGSPVTQTYTQPTITRNANGAATNVPAIVIT